MGLLAYSDVLFPSATLVFGFFSKIGWDRFNRRKSEQELEHQKQTHFNDMYDAHIKLQKEFVLYVDEVHDKFKIIAAERAALLLENAELKRIISEFNNAVGVNSERNV